HLSVLRQTRLNPDAFTPPQRARRLIGGLPISDDGIEERERLTVLQRLVVPPDDAQDWALRVVQPIFANESESILQLVESRFRCDVKRRLDDVPVQTGRLEGLFRRRRPIQLGAKPMPWFFTDVKHGCPAAF